MEIVFEALEVVGCVGEPGIYAVADHISESSVLPHLCHSARPSVFAQNPLVICL